MENIHVQYVCPFTPAGVTPGIHYLNTSYYTTGKGGAVPSCPDTGFRQYFILSTQMEVHPYGIELV